MIPCLTRVIVACPKCFTPKRSSLREIIYAEGVHQFQPRVTPWVTKKILPLNSEGVAEFIPLYTKQESGVGSSIKRLANAFSVHQIFETPFPGCCPGLKLTNAFGVKTKGPCASSFTLSRKQLHDPAASDQSPKTQDQRSLLRHDDCGDAGNPERFRPWTRRWLK